MCSRLTVWYHAPSDLDPKFFFGYFDHSLKTTDFQFGLGQGFGECF